MSDSDDEPNLNSPFKLVRSNSKLFKLAHEYGTNTLRPEEHQQRIDDFDEDFDRTPPHNLHLLTVDTNYSGARVEPIVTLAPIMSAEEQLANITAQMERMMNAMEQQSAKINRLAEEQVKSNQTITTLQQKIISTGMANQVNALRSKAYMGSGSASTSVNADAHMDTAARNQGQQLAPQGDQHITHNYYQDSSKRPITINASAAATRVLNRLDRFPMAERDKIETWAVLALETEEAEIPPVVRKVITNEMCVATAHAIKGKRYASYIRDCITTDELDFPRDPFPRAGGSGGYGRRSSRRGGNSGSSRGSRGGKK
jgi:hypothetical protein